MIPTNNAVTTEAILSSVTSVVLKDTYHVTVETTILEMIPTLTTEHEDTVRTVTLTHMILNTVGTTSLAHWRSPSMQFICKLTIQRVMILKKLTELMAMSLLATKVVIVNTVIVKFIWIINFF